MKESYLPQFNPAPFKSESNLEKKRPGNMVVCFEQTYDIATCRLERTPHVDSFEARGLGFFYFSQPCFQSNVASRTRSEMTPRRLWLARLQPHQTDP